MRADDARLDPDDSSDASSDASEGEGEEEDDEAWHRWGWEARSKRAWTVSAARRGAALAFCMVRHERLGAESVWGGLPAELLYYIVRAFVLV